MKLLFSVGLGLLFAVACQSSSHRGQLAIVGGLEFGGLPAVGTLRGPSMRCSGTLISSQLVLTAAHCLRRLSPGEELWFHVGKFARTPEASYRVTRLWPHPAYQARETLNDIAVVELAERVPDSLRPIPFYPSTDQSWQEQQIFVVGYGHSDGIGQKGSGVKRAVWMPITAMKKDKLLSDPKDGRSTCQGDSGGPALVRWKEAPDGFAIVGVTVAGADTSCQSSSIFVRTDHYREFLENPDSSTDQGAEAACSILGLERSAQCSEDGNTLSLSGRYRLSCKADPWESVLLKEDCQSPEPSRLCREGRCD